VVNADVTLPIMLADFTDMNPFNAAHRPAALVSVVENFDP
jgi:hypothetical protein